VIERFWWAPGIYPGQTKPVSHFLPAISLSLSTLDMDMGFNHGMGVLGSLSRCSLLAQWGWGHSDKWQEKGWCSWCLL